MHCFHILAETRFGRAFTCESASCNAIHLEFGNVAFNLKHGEFYQFKNLVESLDEDYCDRFFAESLWTRTVQIQLKPTLTMFALNYDELQDVRRLLRKTAFALEQPLSELTKVMVDSQGRTTLRHPPEQFDSLATLATSFAKSLSLN